LGLVCVCVRVCVAPVTPFPLCLRTMQDVLVGSASRHLRLSTLHLPLLSLHIPSLDSQIQVTGRKRWHLCDPKYTSHMYGAGKIDTFNPDYRSFPKFREARCILDVVRST
jgi:hypothetical protein